MITGQVIGGQVSEGQITGANITGAEIEGAELNSAKVNELQVMAGNQTTGDDGGILGEVPVIGDTLEQINPLN
ncbi:hypothetical protein BH23THE1_BH23THE1_20890 [soil metagenome]